MNAQYAQSYVGTGEKDRRINGHPTKPGGGIIGMQNFCRFGIVSSGFDD